MPSRSSRTTAPDALPGEREAARLLNYLEGRREKMVRLLTLMVRAESPSDNPRAQRRILRILETELRRTRFRTRRIAGRSTGGLLFARPAERIRGAGQAYQLLLGHCDTVWPVGTLAGMPVTLDGDRLRGPGVFDMKAGLLQMLFALRALRRLRLRPTVVPLVLINSDEEIGSPESQRWICRLSRLVRRAFVLEPALGLAGRLKTARKGVGRFRMVIEGKAAHAGLDPGQGASAILELSHQIRRLYALDDPGRGVSVNVGMIAGGIGANVVAPRVEAQIDVRAQTEQDARELDQRIRSFSPVTSGVRLSVEGGFRRPPMEATPRNQALFRLAREMGGLLGLDLEQTTAGGGSDGNLTSQLTATLDGLGGVGDGAHAEHEEVSVRGLIERTALLALLLLGPRDVA